MATDWGQPCLRLGVIMLAKRDFLTPPELAEELGVSEKTLANWRVEGRGPDFERHGNRIRYYVEDVRAWRNKHRHSSTREYGRNAQVQVLQSPPDAREVAARRGVITAQLIELVRELDALDASERSTPENGLSKKQRIGRERR
jgi:DNA-binding transcriptional MerR regulator